MSTSQKNKSIFMVGINTISFTTCFACWFLYAALITYLKVNKIFIWTDQDVFILKAVPILTGAIMRLPFGILTDKYGGRLIFTILMLISALGTASVYFATNFFHFFIAGLLLGISGASFAVGVAHCSEWSSDKWKGTALGIFGVGNIGAMISTIGGTYLLKNQLHSIEQGWRYLPLIYSITLIINSILFWILARNNRNENKKSVKFSDQISFLKDIRVWRFGLYYFYVFGCFVGLSLCLNDYYIQTFKLDMTSAGFYTGLFIFPASVVRAIGGYMSDKWGARKVMYGVLGISILCCSAMIFVKMLAIFVTLSVILGFVMGVGKAAVYKFIPTYYPENVGAVGGLVGLLGGIGGFCCPLIFAWLIDITNFWESFWAFLLLVSLVSLIWMHSSVKQMRVAKIA